MSLPRLLLDASSSADVVISLPERLADVRPSVRGKFLFLGEEKFPVRGVTYGPFGPEGREYPAPEVVGDHFDQMAEVGFNALRTYTVPPRWLLDIALERGLRLMVGLPWEEHVAFLDHRRQARDIERRLCQWARACAGHPAVLCYAIGNEIPAPIVRWYGHRRVERFLGRLAVAVRDEDPEGLITYVNYPSTEYLELPFLDIASFNVYLEQTNRLEAYLARLHNVAGDRPLVLSEIGLDSRRNGLSGQARALNKQIRTAFRDGCAGLFVFSWSDEWHRGGAQIDDWDFGLTSRDGSPKLAMLLVREALAETPFPPGTRWPRISVVVCSLNGGRTIRDCMEALTRLEYPDFEVIVVNDGSTDSTAVIARSYGFPVITTHNQGLSGARNAGWQAATGEIVAYVDDDAYPDPHWLHYLASTFLRTDHAAVGGPNIPPPGDGTIAECVAMAPGGPIHVLVSDEEAEHIPGCNMAIRKSVLEELGGFDTRFRAAGDDVDICWRIRDRRWTIGFNPAAVVWHHRRNSIRAYWRQQRGYGKAEALLERKWPARYNALGHVAWAGSVYGPGVGSLQGRQLSIYQGTWGTAPFQTSARKPSRFGAIFAMPEWALVVVALGGLASLGATWPPLLVAAPLALALIAAAVIRAWAITAPTLPGSHQLSRWGRLTRHLSTALLHITQPVARLRGRAFTGLTPWRRRGGPHMTLPRTRTYRVWREVWRGGPETLSRIEAELKARGHPVTRGGPYQRFDLEVRGGSLGAVRLLTAIEEHGFGRQLVRLRARPIVPPAVMGLLLGIAGVAVAAAMAKALIPWIVLACAASILAWATLSQCALACGAVRAAVLGEV